MRKIIKLTESDLRKIIKRVISEQFDSDYYDIILDLYNEVGLEGCLLYTSPSPRDGLLSRMPSSA